MKFFAFLIAWVSVNAAWGGFRPLITVEYDENTGHLLFVTIRYNKRMASKSLGFNAFELKNKLASEFQDAGVFVGGFTMVEVLQKAPA